jgi:hypothetical protein
MATLTLILIRLMLILGTAFPAAVLAAQYAETRQRPPSVSPPTHPATPKPHQRSQLSHHRYTAENTGTKF